ncbi:MAG: hypothetical protein Q4A39_01560 [Eubacteriales bacterium]|nr:hypothetical protein [Eubacteriales bacterium]
MTLHICHLWPDAFSANGSAGNLRCLSRRLAWRGLEFSVSELPLDAPDEPDWENIDLLYLGSGPVSSSPALRNAVSRLTDGLRTYIENGGVCLAVCEGLELMGKSIDLHGETLPGLGILDMDTVYADRRTVGDYAFDAGEELGILYGFSNRAGLLRTPASLPPLGTILYGTGDREDAAEGVHYRNLYGCHAHGPLLPKNPVLTDTLLLTALRRHDPDFPALVPLDDSPANNARAFIADRLQKH